MCAAMDLTVLVFSSIKDSACGHALSLREIVQRQECPICGQSIGFIQEAAPLPSRTALANERRFVYFKLGKVCYRLIVGGRREKSWWSSMLPGGHDASSTSTAQARIRKVMGLSDEMKVRWRELHSHQSHFSIDTLQRKGTLSFKARHGRGYDFRQSDRTVDHLLEFQGGTNTYGHGDTSGNSTQMA